MARFWPLLAETVVWSGAGELSVGLDCVCTVRADGNNLVEHAGVAILDFNLTIGLLVGMAGKIGEGSLQVVLSEECNASVMRAFDHRSLRELKCTSRMRDPWP
jgi:hypothetical protein